NENHERSQAVHSSGSGVCRLENTFQQAYRGRTGDRAKVHGNLVTLIYNASKLVADRINALLNDQQAALFLFFKIQNQNSVRFCILKKSNYEIDSCDKILIIIKFF